MVGFENTSLEVSEGAGKVEICVKINQLSVALTGIQHFNLTVKTLAGTAGKLYSSISMTAIACMVLTFSLVSSDLQDFLPINQTLEGFSNSTRRQCFNVTITDDDVREDAETFTLTLEKPRSLLMVLIHPGTITVTIKDDDDCKDIWD